MQPGTSAEPVLAHVLFMDIVGCSKLPSDEQHRIVGRLQEAVRESAEFKRSLECDQVISLPTGDGMALAFFNKLDAAVQCAVEITKSIQADSLCKIRMGVHSGPVFNLEDINHKRNISGAGINQAERVMSCGAEGHILLSDNVAESLRHLSAWREKIQDIGACQVKDGWIHVWNLVDGPIGNPALPKSAKQNLRRRRFLIATGAALLALVVVAAVGSAFWLGRTRKGVHVEDQASIAVLPLIDMSPEKNQEYFSDGLTEELMNGLAKIPGLRVAGRTSSFQFKGTTEDCRVIGEKLHVATLLEGSVRKQGNRARIGVQLIKSSDGFDLWSESFDRDLTDIFAVQDEIARAVTGALRVRLAEGTGKAVAKPPNVEAYNAFLQGEYFLVRRNKESLNRAVSYFEQAIQLAPGYAPAWAELGEARISQAGPAYIPVEEGYREGRAAVERALGLDADLGGAYATMGEIQMLHDWDWAGAAASYQRALTLEPGDAGVIRAAGSLARCLGHLDDALARYQRAVEIDPLNPNGYKNLGIVLYYAGRYDEARAAFGKALDLTPEMGVTHGLLGQVYLAQANPQAAVAEAEKEKHPAYRLCGLALVYHTLGRKNESDANLKELIAKLRAEAPYQIAEVYAFRGETDLAFQWLDQAYKERDGGLAEMKGDPLLNNLKGDPRYRALLQKMRLPL